MDFEFDTKDDGSDINLGFDIINYEEMYVW